jgi:DNA adenine methylase
MRPAFRYHGAKHAFLNWILPKMPRHKIFVDVFGGAGNVVLNKTPAWLDVYNDLNSDVVNFFRVLRDHTDELVRLVALSPYSREEYKLCYQANPQVQKLQLFDFEKMATI